jgi:hypothetical protein
VKAKLFKVMTNKVRPVEDTQEIDKKIHLCKRCGKPISDIDSILNGMGPTCYQKHLCEVCQNKSKKLF